MSTLEPTPRTRSWTVAVLALLAVMLAPGSTWGACGRHGVPAAPASSESAQFEALALAGALPADPAPRPCSGAFCTGNPAPPIAPTTIDAQSIDSWAWLANLPLPSPTASRPVPADGFSDLPSPLPSSIFHPPRPTSHTA